MLVKKYMVINDDCVVEYDLIVVEEEKEICYSLFTTDSKIWAENIRGVRLMSMIDDGNGLSFEKDLKDITYNEALYVRLLLGIERNISKKDNSPDYKIIEYGEEIKI